ncbi:MAG: translation initiation factor eIF-2B [bacterium]|nr:translation initiation factor eIF-2B [bacterium]
MNVQETCKAIKELRIQGAENITTAALLAIKDAIQRSKAKTKEAMLWELDLARIHLINTRPTEPEMRNYLNAFFSYAEQEEYKKQKLLKKIDFLLQKQKENKDKINFHGDSLIKNHAKIYTHCHSSTVNAILKKANKRKIITVYNTETRPLFQGRITATELAKEKIPIHHYVDASMCNAIKEADIILIGADAISSEGVYNKIGSELLAILANHYHKPLYVCASLMKLDAHREIIEERSAKEIWEKAPKEVQIHNPAFEKIHLKHIKGIICEQGILRPKKFIKKAKTI